MATTSLFGKTPSLAIKTILRFPRNGLFNKWLLLTLCRVFSRVGVCNQKAVICMCYAFAWQMHVTCRLINKRAISSQHGIIVFEDTNHWEPCKNMQDILLVFSTTIFDRVLHICAIPFDPMWFEMMYQVKQPDGSVNSLTFNGDTVDLKTTSALWASLYDGSRPTNYFGTYVILVNFMAKYSEFFYENLRSVFKIVCTNIPDFTLLPPPPPTKLVIVRMTRPKLLTEPYQTVPFTANFELTREPRSKITFARAIAILYAVLEKLNHPVVKRYYGLIKVPINTRTIDTLHQSCMIILRGNTREKLMMFYPSVIKLIDLMDAIAADDLTFERIFQSIVYHAEGLSQCLKMMMPPQWRIRVAQIADTAAPAAAGRAKRRRM